MPTRSARKNTLIVYGIGLPPSFEVAQSARKDYPPHVWALLARVYSGEDCPE